MRMLYYESRIQAVYFDEMPDLKCKGKNNYQFVDQSGDGPRRFALYFVFFAHIVEELFHLRAFVVFGELDSHFFFQSAHHAYSFERRCEVDFKYSSGEI